MHSSSPERIDRRALVNRHNPVIRGLQPLSPLAVGNGAFAFTADITGLQSFPEAYEAPLGTQSEWGWHSTGGAARHSASELRLQDYDTNGRKVGYPSDSGGQEELYHWLRQNPHRIQLGQIGLRLLLENGRAAGVEDLCDIGQELQLWSGLLVSRFKVESVSVEVQTCCHPERDQIAVIIRSPLVSLRRLAVTFGFPSPLPMSADWMNTVGLNWADGGSHHTEYVPQSLSSGTFQRTMDDDRYIVQAAWSHGEMKPEAQEHRYVLDPGDDTADALVLTIGFSPDASDGPLAEADDILSASASGWESFWLSGGAVELTGSRDPRAVELERRIVLSQFVTAIHCAGSLPPQETGLLYSSWFGKFHLEMHWWHAVHFALWGRTGLLRRSLGWYARTLPSAQALAKSQGYRGARWPKMVGPEGRDSPSPIGPLLIWQQPHPIVFAELCYKADPTPETLAYFRDIVMETAEFMSSFAVWDRERGRYVLGPPLIPAQEDHAPEATWNPAFELEYWRHGLELAGQWRARLRLPPEEKWLHVATHLSDLPVADGVYLAHENCPDTFTRVNTDHPSMLGALGMLPGLSVDHDIMRATLRRVMNEWQWDTAWGWDFPMTAMTAARLGDCGTAVDALLMNTVKNTYLPNGHNDQRGSLTAYLPGNGGLLAAVALMARGWQGSGEAEAPGFPKDGTWTVSCEGLNAWL